jgi:hypothetical protein
VLARTDTALLFAFSDHTQITNVASWPALTSPRLASDWTRTHSCGVTCLCFLPGELAVGSGELGVGLAVGEVEVGVGLGLAEVELGLGLGVVVAEVDAEVFEGGEDVAVALDEGLSLADVLGEADALLLADVLGEAGALLLADVLGAASEVADLNSDEELTSATAGSWLMALFVADDSAVLFGVDPHTADLAVVVD